MEIQYVVTFQEFVEAASQGALAAARKRNDLYFQSWRGVVLLIFLLATGLLISQWRGPVLLVAPLLLIVYFGLAYLYRRIFCPRVFRRRYEELKVGLDLRCRISEQGIESETIDGLRFGRLLWPAFLWQIESENTFVLYLNSLQFLIVPKRAMTPQQLEEFRTFAAHVQNRTPREFKTQLGQGIS